MKYKTICIALLLIITTVLVGCTENVSLDISGVDTIYSSNNRTVMISFDDATNKQLLVNKIDTIIHGGYEFVGMSIVNPSYNGHNCMENYMIFTKE